MIGYICICKSENYWFIHGDLESAQKMLNDWTLDGLQGLIRKVSL